ncbi:MAG: AAA family ATPase, partial [Veillonella sp.]|nr:AAA family ATPase [Veillonella sp.]
IVQNQVKSNMELSLRGLMVLYSIRKLKQSNIDDIIRDCQLSPAICEMNVKQLLKMNIIQSVDMDGKQLYYLNTADYVYRLHGTSQVYDVTPTYGNPYIKAFHSLLNAVNQVTRTDVANALGISKPQAYRLIMKLFNKGILEKVGNGKYTSYKYTDTYVAEKLRLERMTEKSLLPSI